MRSQLNRTVTQDEIEAWRPWFAWWPTSVLDGADPADGRPLYRVIWWEWIEKRQRYLRIPDFGPLTPEYRLPPKLAPAAPPRGNDPLNLSGERGKHGDIVWSVNDWYWMPFECCRHYKTQGCAIETAGKVAEVQ